MTGALFRWHGGSWLEDVGLPAMGAYLCLVAGLPIVEAPGHPRHPSPKGDTVVNEMTPGLKPFTENLTVDRQ